MIDLIVNSVDISTLSFQKVNGPTPGSDRSAFYAYWEFEPTSTYQLPSLVVLPDDENITSLLAALGAMPNAPSPITAFIRFLSRRDLAAREVAPGLLHLSKVSGVLFALMMAETLLLVERPFSYKMITSAVCKRTFSYTWASSLYFGINKDDENSLADRWMHAYSILNGSISSSKIKWVLSLMMPALILSSVLLRGGKASGLAGAISEAILFNDKLMLDQVLRRGAERFGVYVGLDDFSKLAREDRGVLLQNILKIADKVGDLDGIIISAFIATKVAPGSLEHLDLLRGYANPQVIVWYAFFAGLQTPEQIVSNTAGLAHRVIRDLSLMKGVATRPSSDIAFNELLMFERVGGDYIYKKILYSNEIQVELCPLVVANYSAPSRAKVRSESEEYGQLNLIPSPEIDIKEKSQRERLMAISEILMSLIKEIPDPGDGPSAPKRVYTSKRKY